LVDETGVLVGLISDGDLKRHMAPDLLTKKASTLMTHSPKTITTTALATEAVHLMQTGRFTLLFVVDDAGKPCGILNIHHCLQAGIL
jgi:arabinose-5-phosphate isomerase